MRVMLTGGVGFIGYHVARALLERGDHVHVLDDFSNAPYPRAQKKKNQAELLAEFSASCTITEGCVTDADAVERAMAGAEAVLHLAGLAGVRPSFAEPSRYAKVNVEGTARVLEAVRAHRIQRFVFASSSSVYGDATPLPAREDAEAVMPESPYAASKRSAELLTQATSKSMSGVACTALRFFTVYGPRQRPEMAITKFARALLDGEPFEMFGDGSMRRDFTHVSDIVRGILLALERAPLEYRAYNLGSGRPVTLRHLIEKLEAASGAHAQILTAGKPLGDVEATFADIGRAKRELDWEPHVELEPGLRTVLDSLRA